MDISSDYADLLRILNEYHVKYLVIGAYAVIYYTEPRYTKDIDIWAKLDPDNVKNLYKALAVYGAPLKGIKPEDFLKKDIVYQMGVAPVRIDVLMSLPPLDFEKAWAKRVKTKYGHVSTQMIDIHDLINIKTQTARPQDLLDTQELKKVLKAKSKKSFG